MNNLAIDFETDLGNKDIDNMGSFNHSYLQARLAFLLYKAGKHTALTELSLDIGKLDLNKFQINVKEELKPDICVYPKRGLARPYDISKMSEMPLSTIEILSPSQNAYEILRKFEAYFALGIKSCWLVDPAIETVTVYAAFDKHSVFSEGNILDDATSIQLPVQEIFGSPS